MSTVKNQPPVLLWAETAEEARELAQWAHVDPDHPDVIIATKPGEIVDREDQHIVLRRYNPSADEFIPKAWKASHRKGSSIIKKIRGQGLSTHCTWVDFVKLDAHTYVLRKRADAAEVNPKWQKLPEEPHKVK